MRDYQKYGFRWLKTIATYKFGGILADDMGFGKTIQAISLILDMKQRNKKCPPALIVCQSSLTLNWEVEIQRFASGLKTLTVIGGAGIAYRENYQGEIQCGDYLLSAFRKAHFDEDFLNRVGTHSLSNPKESSLVAEFICIYVDF